jgi:hypothetical protein
MNLVLNPLMLDWPQHCKKISITNGSRLGMEQNMGVLNPGALLLEGSGLLDLDIYSLPSLGNGFSPLMNLGFAGSCSGLGYLAGFSQNVLVNQSLALDNLAGSHRSDIAKLASQLPDWLTQGPVAGGVSCSGALSSLFSNNSADYKSCFIPLLSSAGIKTFDQAAQMGGVSVQSLFQGSEKFSDPQHVYSYFDVVYAPETNQTHVEITDENINWLISEISGPEAEIFQNEVLASGNLFVQNQIIAGRDVGKYGQGCTHIYSASMYPQYINNGQPVNTCGPVFPAPGSSVTWKAGQRIILEPGFDTDSAAYFEASIQNGANCGSDVGVSGGRFARASVIDIAATKMNTNEKQLLYPNPVQSELFIDGIQAGDVVEIYDIQGRQFSKSFNCLAPLHKINVSDMPDGYYFIYLKGSGRERVHSFIKNTP